MCWAQPGCTSYLSWYCCCHTLQRRSPGSVILKRQMLKVLPPLWMKEHPTSTAHSRKISVLLTLHNTDHKQVLGLSAVQQLEQKTHLVNHQNVNLDRKPEFNSGHGFYNEFMGGKNKARHLTLIWQQSILIIFGILYGVYIHLCTYVLMRQKLDFFNFSCHTELLLYLKIASYTAFKSHL